MAPTKKREHKHACLNLLPQKNKKVKKIHQNKTKTKYTHTPQKKGKKKNTKEKTQPYKP